MSTVARIPALHISNEIDLFALFQALWLRKTLILVFALAGSLVALGLSFLVTPQYKVSSVLRPAALNELDALNRSQIYTLPAKDAMLRVGASLESYDTRLEFFRANRNLFKAFEEPGRSLEQSFEAFNRTGIKLVLPDPKTADFLSAYIGLEMIYPQGVDGVAVLNGLVEHAINSEREQIAADLKVIIDNRLAEVEGQINAARGAYENEKQAQIASLLEADSVRREQLQDELNGLRFQLKTLRADRIAQLTEAISIARSLGINRPSTPASLADSIRPGTGSVMRTEVNNQQIPLYFMGTEALEAERTALLQRSNDDFTDRRIAQIGKELQQLEHNRQVEVLKKREDEDLFLKNVEQLRAEKARLTRLNTDMNNLKLVTIDRKALAPDRPQSPDRPLISVLGLIFGVMLAVFYIIIPYFIDLRRSQAAHRIIDSQ